MANHGGHAAIFSAKRECFPLRDEQSMPSRIILRSVPEDDMETLIDELWAKFPEQCRSLRMPLGDIRQYFDFYDQHQHGGMFLTAVLSEICQRNLTQRHRIFEYTQEWLRINQPAFQNLHVCSFPFSEDDVEACGVDFLNEVLEGLRVQRSHIDNSVTAEQGYGYVPAHLRIDHVGTGNWPYFPPSGQQFWPHDQPHYSAPATSQLAFARPQMPSSLPSLMPDAIHPNGYHMKFPQQAQPFPSAKTETSNGPLRSAPPYPAFRKDWHKNINDSSIDVPRQGFSNRVVSLPSQAGSGGSFTYPRMQTGTRTLHHPASKQRRFSISKRPAYSGHSNDARLLGQHNAPRGYGSHPFSTGPPIPCTNPHPPLQQSFGPPTGIPFHNDGYGESNAARQAAGAAGAEAPLAQLINTGFEDHPSVIQDGFGAAPQKLFYGQYQPTHALPPRPSGPSRPDVEQLYDPKTPKRHMGHDITPPRFVQGPINGAFAGSPTPRRSSRTSARQYEGPTNTQITRHRQMSSASQTYKSQQDGLPSSDRQVWIGGLNMDTDIARLNDILKEWGPVTLDARISPSSKNAQGFTFANFQNPEDATAAIEALSCQWIDSLRTRLYLRLAWTPPSHFGGSPKKQKSPGKGAVDDVQRLQKAKKGQQQYHQNFNASAPPSAKNPAPSDENVQITSNARRYDAGKYPVRSNPLHITAAPSDAFDYQLNQVLESEPLSLASDPNIPGENTNGEHEDLSCKDVLCGPAPTKNASRNNIPASSTTPSPKQPKVRDSSKDGLVCQTMSPDKKGILDPNFESLKLKTADPLDHQGTKVSQHDELIIGDEDKENTNKPNVELVEQESTSIISNVQNGYTNHDSVTAAAPGVTQSSEETSPVRSASTSRRRLSSASLIVTTDHTSYAQSEHSDKSIDEAEILTDHLKGKIQSPRITAGMGVNHTDTNGTSKSELASHPKRALLGDPKVLVAVPKLIPFMKMESLRKRKDIEASKQSSHIENQSNLVDLSKESTSPSKSLSGFEADIPQIENFERGTRRKSSQADEVEGFHSPKDDIEQATSTAPDDVHETAADSNTACHLDAPFEDVASPEGDSFTSAQTTVKDDLGAIVDLEEHFPAMPMENQHPVVQQKKRKSKKGNKSKKSKASVAASVETAGDAHSRGNSLTESKATTHVPKAETPFISDDNQRLPVPTFTIRNHSSMHSRTRINIGLFSNASQHSTVNDGGGTIASTYASVLLASAVKPPVLIFFSRGTDESSTNVPNADITAPVTVNDPLDDPLDKTPNHSETRDWPSEDFDASTNQTGPSNEAERQARSEQIEQYCRQNTLASRAEIMDMLDAIAPQDPGPTTPSQKLSDDDMKEEHTPDSSDADSKTSITVKCSPVQEIASNGDVHSSSPSTMSLEDTERGPDPINLTLPQSSEDATDDMKVTQDTKNNTETDDTFSMAFHKGQSPTASPEHRGRLRSISPTKGLGISIMPPPFSTKKENTSPSGSQPRKTLSYKEVAISPSTPPIQSGDIVEIVSKDMAADGKGGRRASVVRKVGAKDPWRVPSSEQPWGAPASKPKGKSSPEILQAWK
ncbi:MAG: hypothetical protein Q9222_005306 [Ikaeria aurantiellina]